jgi:uncharacterized protein
VIASGTDWQAACEAHVLAAGGMDGAHDLGHLRRVWRQAQIIAADEAGVDRAVLQVACFLHDLVNLPKIHRDRNAASVASADAAVVWLASQAFAPEKLASVHHAIAAHSFSARIPAETVEARIVQDADRLEALGAIGIARMFHVAGSTGGALFDPADPMALRRGLDDRAFALDHLQVKLFGLFDTMQTATGRAIAAERADWMASFRTRLLTEIA